MNQDELKKQAAERTIEFIQSGMILGLGSGSTVTHALRRLGERIRRGELTDILGVPTSKKTAEQAQQFGIPLTTLDEHPELDLTIDGADEVDPSFNLIKGLGGALLREKIVAIASKRLIIMVDESKLVKTLGTRAPLPVEVIPFSWRIQMPFLESLGARPVLRLTSDGQPFRTDGDHYIIDCHFPGIPNPYPLADVLNARPGILEHGLFLNMTDLVVVASTQGVQILSAQEQRIP